MKIKTGARGRPAGPKGKRLTVYLPHDAASILDQVQMHFLERYHWHIGASAIVARLLAGETPDAIVARPFHPALIRSEEMISETSNEL